MNDVKKQRLQIGDTFIETMFGVDVVHTIKKLHSSYSMVSPDWKSLTKEQRKIISDGQHAENERAYNEDPSRMTYYKKDEESDRLARRRFIDAGETCAKA